MKFQLLHIVKKLLKMSHLNFDIFRQFFPIKTDLSGNTVWPQASGFQKLAKMDHFWHFELTFVHSKCKRSSLRSQCWMRLFLWISNTVPLREQIYLRSSCKRKVESDATFAKRKSKKILIVIGCRIIAVACSLDSHSTFKFLPTHSSPLLFSKIGMIVHFSRVCCCTSSC